MNRLTARGAGIIMISSELPELLGMSDRILVMHRGRIQAELDRRGRHRGARAQRRAGTRAIRQRSCEPAGQLIVPARQFGTLIGLLALCAVLWILTPHFLTVSNLLNVAEQTSINAIVAVGMTFVILSGGIDLSVGSIVALSGVVLGTALQAGQPLAGRAAAGAGGRRCVRPRRTARSSAGAGCRRSS